MASRIYSLSFVVITGLFAILCQTDLPFLTAQAQTTQDRKAEADRLLKVGNQQLAKSQYQEALQLCQSALDIYRSSDNRKSEGNTLIVLGCTNNYQGQHQKAIVFFQQSLAIAKQIGDRTGEVYSLIGLGSAYNYLGQFQKAFVFFQQSLAIAKQIGDRSGEVYSLFGLGYAYGSLGQFQKAIDYSQQSLAIAKQIGNRKDEGYALIGLGSAYNYLGQLQKAVDLLQESLAIFNQIGNRDGEGWSLVNLGNSYSTLGQYYKAIDFWQQSLAIFKQTGNRYGEGLSLIGLGDAYNILGQYHKAIDFHQQSLAIFNQTGNHNSEGYSLIGIGNDYSALGQYHKAIDFYQQSLAIFKQTGNRYGEGLSLNNLGLAYSSLEQYHKAIDFYQQSLAIFKQIDNRYGEGMSLNNLGNEYVRLGQHQKAIDFYQQSLAIFKQTGNRHGEGFSLNNLGYLFAFQNQSELAILYYKQSVNVHESIRKDIRKLDKSEQKSYLETVSGSYKRLIELLLKQGRVIEALQVLDLLKVQELDDYLKNIKGNDRTSQGIRLLEPEKAMSSQLSAISYEKIPELNQKLANQIQQLPKSEIDKPPDYLQQFPQGTALLYPLILSDRIEIILFAANTPAIHRSVNIKKDDLEKLVTDFKNGLVEGRKDPSDDGFLEPAKKLYDILIKPVEADLKNAKTTTILYAPDGKLRYVPLTALYDGKQFLIENYAVNNLIAYILTDFTPKVSKQPSVLAGAFGGKKGEKLFGQNALPASLVEVSEIGKSIENSKALTETNFSRQATEGQLPNYNILHLATHAEFKSGDPDNSFILFGNGDTLRLRGISELKMPNIDLIVLSACETAVVKSGSGVEILGFGYQIQKAGAKSAIASLWSVSDAGTQKLMQAFYGYVKQGDRSKASALRQAQIDLIRGKQFSHPYYWSPFILIGNGL
ncbi:hypothetical protein TUMEXPCC7403_01250 [Tumidithrix helvetica PCC 7403]|uniref:CHAT domain-containing protein n=1 Tax=Tumidithrix helvetica TaxID=3457545 RepID=UPI003CBD68A9